MLLNVMECIDYKEKSDEMKNILRNNIKICLSKEESLLKRFKNYMNIIVYGKIVIKVSKILF